MKLHKEAVIDVVLSVAGGVIGGVATGAFLVSRWLRQAHEGARASSTPSGLRQHHGLPPEEAQR